MQSSVRGQPRALACWAGAQRGPAAATEGGEVALGYMAPCGMHTPLTPSLHLATMHVCWNEMVGERP
jgi:hypothetical protein